MISDEMLKEAADEIAMALIDSLPDSPENEHVFSKRFEKKMKKLIRKTDHPVRYRIIQSSIAVVLVLVMAFGSVLALSPSARAAVVNWLKETVGSWTHYTSVPGHSQAGHEVAFELTSIPDGYTLAFMNEDDGGQSYAFTNEAGQILQFTYIIGGTYTDLYLDTESYHFRNVQCGNIIVDVYIANDQSDRNTIVWEKNDVLFTISAFMEQNELIELINHVHLVNCDN